MFKSVEEGLNEIMALEAPQRAERAKESKYAILKRQSETREARSCA